MKVLFLLCVSFISAWAQQVQFNDPNTNSSALINSVSFIVDRYYPFFGNSDKPSTNEYGVKLVDQDNKYSAMLYFRNQINYPSFEKSKNTFHFFFPEVYYQYIIKQLGEHGSAIVVYREYKDGHNWGEVYFDKYP